MDCISLIWSNNNNNNNNNNNKNNSNTYNLKAQCSVWLAKISITKINKGVAIIKIEEILFQRESAIFNSYCRSYFKVWKLFEISIYIMKLGFACVKEKKLNH